jgi:hypothetical protein
MSDHRHAGGEQYRLTLEALADDDAPAHVRLRAALKALLRAFRLRCRSVEDVTPRLPPVPGGQPAAVQSPLDDAEPAQGPGGQQDVQAVVE